MNKYYLKARLFPTVLTVIPLLILVNMLVSTFLHDTLKAIQEILPLITSLGLSAALLFLMVQVNRTVSKEIFQRFFFQDEIEMPTTNSLLWSDSGFDDSTKEQIRVKIKEKFGINLMSKEEEKTAEPKSRKQIVTAVSQIRNFLRDNFLLLQHNIEYGFFRNILGGSLIAVICSVGIIIYGTVVDEPSTKMTGIILGVIYSVPLFFSKQIINYYGKYYSKILYEQFLSK